MDQKSETPFDLKAWLSHPGDGKRLLAARSKKFLFAQGDKAEAIFYILQGKIKLSVLSRVGKEGVLAILEGGEFFGLNCLVGDFHHACTATALNDCTVMRVEKAIAVTMLNRHPAFAERLMSFLVQRTIRMEEDLIDQLFNSSKKRLARLLLLLVNFRDDNCLEAIAPPISQETLAEMVGTTRSRVNCFMNEFRRQGYIDYGDELLIRRQLFQVLLHD
jgi:CRP-like cAMP-binding protein